ncbi:YusW family protein [Alkalihalophilus pseudofirmus]|uniref:YusW family protein n=1 Tax=Alkalihalophilus pseudofirmus TaxID=79885 RepID=A0AAJ2KZZ1_ALKPS|nr:YusW family protein [Alkalihalophilus pseudofirmus]MDV2885088.1 YusW family protein [Alkalihalophilus pseudofirmus]
MKHSYIAILFISLFALAGCNQGAGNDSVESDSVITDTSDAVTFETEDAVAVSEIARGDEQGESAEQDQFDDQQVIEESDLEQWEEPQHHEDETTEVEESPQESTATTKNLEETADEKSEEAESMSVLASGVKEFELDVEFEDGGEVEIEYEVKKDKPKAKVKMKQKGKGKSKHEIKGNDAVQYTEALLAELYVENESLTDAVVEQLLDKLEVETSNVKKVEIEIEFENKSKLKYKRD